MVQTEAVCYENADKTLLTFLCRKTASTAVQRIFLFNNGTQLVPLPRGAVSQCLLHANAGQRGQPGRETPGGREPARGPQLPAGVSLWAGDGHRAPAEPRPAAGGQRPQPQGLEADGGRAPAWMAHPSTARWWTEGMLTCVFVSSLVVVVLRWSDCKKKTKSAFTQCRRVVLSLCLNLSVQHNYCGDANALKDKCIKHLYFALWYNHVFLR